MFALPLNITDLLNRATVDSFNELTGKPLTNREIGEILLCLLFVSSENTATGLTLAIVNLVNHPEHWDRARAESRKFLRNGDVKGIMTSEYLHACVMEMARLNSHMFAILRRPREKLVIKKIVSYVLGCQKISMYVFFN